MSDRRFAMYRIDMHVKVNRIDDFDLVSRDEYRKMLEAGYSQDRDAAGRVYLSGIKGFTEPDGVTRFVEWRWYQQG